MRSLLSIVATIVLFVSAGCFSVYDESSWHTENLPSFNIKVPPWMQKRNVQGIVEFASPKMQLDFNEVYGFGYTPEKAKKDEARFKQRLNTVGSTNDYDFIKQIGNRFARITVSQNEEWINGGYPGKYAVQVFIPDLRGGYLDVFITYCHEMDTRTALLIAESITCKP